MTKRFSSFSEFYPFYLSEHANRMSRRLHFAGSTGVIACIVAALFSGNAWWWLAASSTPSARAACGSLSKKGGGDS